MAKGPVLIDLEDAPAAPVTVDKAPPVPDPDGYQIPPDGRAMQMAARLASAKPSRLSRLAWALAGALLTAAIAAATYDFVLRWVERAPIIGWVLTALAAAFVVVLLIIAYRELRALMRLSRIDDLRRDAIRARETQDLESARDVVDKLFDLYEKRKDLDWGRDRLERLENDQMDAASLLDVAESTLLSPLDQMAEREVEAAARQVATVTALVPLALADVTTALTANLRMIRRIAEVYGGRTGTFGGWRLTRLVMTHLVATGAVAVGDDMLEPVLGGSLLGKLSRRFGEGLVNGALTARVGVAAMEVCRPLAFAEDERPRARDLVKSALTGLVGRRD